MSNSPLNPLLQRNGALDVRAVAACLARHETVLLGGLAARPSDVPGVCDVVAGFPERHLLKEVAPSEAAWFLADCWDRLLEHGQCPPEPQVAADLFGCLPTEEMLRAFRSAVPG